MQYTLGITPSYYVSLSQVLKQWVSCSVRLWEDSIHHRMVGNYKIKSFPLFQSVLSCVGMRRLVSLTTQRVVIVVCVLV